MAASFEDRADLIVFDALVAPPLGVRVPSSFVISTVEFRAPDLDDVGQPLQQDAFDLLIKLRYPVLEICVAFEIQTINLVDI